MSRFRLGGLLIFSSLILIACVALSAHAMAVTARRSSTTPTPTPVVTQAGTTTTLTANPTSVWLQTSSTLSGTLTTTDPTTNTTTPVANEAIQIQQEVGTTTTWNTIANVTTDMNGAFTSPVTIASTSSTFRAVFSGDSNYTASQSADVQVTGFVASTRLYRTGPTEVTANRSETYTAHYETNDSRMTSRQAIAGAKVDVYRKDVYGGGWIKQTILTTDANGNISWRATVNTPTDWHLVGHATARSTAAESVVYRPRVIPIGRVYVLPSSAPKPDRLAPQPGAIGLGANPEVTSISNAVWNRMVGRSWHSGCPVGRSELAYMTINYWGFDGYRHRGEMVFRASHKAQFVAAFTRLYNSHIPLHGMYLVDTFGYSSVTHGANDYASMQHDNTSAFNCRWVDGSPGVLSPHAYGTAVDINPYENPYNSAKGWTPNSWWRYHYINPYTWRSTSDTVVQDMNAAGFNWTYQNDDSQHFDVR